MRFRFTDGAIDTDSSRRELLDPGAGGYASFEGWVRNFNEGQEVTRLEYEAFQDLALKEGERILAEAASRFPIKRALCIHRVGSLELTDLAVWVGVSAAHRGEAFDACRYIIDEIKHRLAGCSHLLEQHLPGIIRPHRGRENELPRAPVTHSVRSSPIRNHRSGSAPSSRSAGGA